MNILFLVLGTIIGLIIAWFIAKSKYHRTDLIEPSEYNLIKNENIKLNSEISSKEERIDELINQRESLSDENREIQARVVSVSAELSSQKTMNDELSRRMNEHKAEIERLNEYYRKEFENLANKIFDEASGKFVEKNNEKLEVLLNPFKEKIEEFKKRIEETYIDSTKERSSLKTEILKLVELNNRVSEEANNLTKALKGDSKTQGDWGEVILESILENSGLSKDREYFVQSSFTGEDGSRLRPDIIVRFPGNRNIVIDSKVSLTAYEKFSSAETEDDRSSFLKEHLKSIKKHVDDLAKKRYQDIFELDSLDFVLLFIPIEPAYLTAIHNDNYLWKYGYDKGVTIISPTNLIAILRMIESMWRIQNQNDNALEIAKRGGQLYDKFVGFVSDLELIGKRIGDTQNSYLDAMNKLQDGKGNLIRQAEMLKELGAKTKKQIPDNLF